MAYLHTIAARLNKLKTPTSFDDYVAGTQPFSLEIPRNIVAFARRTPSEIGSQDDYHSRFVFIINTGGSGTIVLDNKLFPFRPGTAFFVFPFQFHHLTPDKAQEKISWLFLTGEISRPQNLTVLKNLPLPVSETIADSVCRLIDRYASARKSKPYISNEIALLTASILNDFTGEALSRNEPQPSGTMPSGIIERINYHVFGNLSSTLSLAEISRALSMSESHLRSLYRHHTGFSLGSYIKRLKILRAMELITNSGMNFSQVAQECGYETLNSFCRIFRQKIGVSPGEYRKRQRGRTSITH